MSRWSYRRVSLECLNQNMSGRIDILAQSTYSEQTDAALGSTLHSPS